MRFLDFSTGLRYAATAVLCLSPLVVPIPRATALAQQPASDDSKKARDKETPADKSKETPPDKSKRDEQTAALLKGFKADKPETWTAEQVTELLILAYGSRRALEYVGTNRVEEGAIKLAATDGNPAQEGKFVRRFLRKETSDKDLIRIDVTLQNHVYTFGFNGFSSWAAQDGSNFKPEPDAETSFLASLVHDYHALLRYKEDGASIAKIGIDRVAGIDATIIELTHKDGSKTRYYVSNKSFHILHLDYEIKLTPEAAPTKFRESFYEYRPVQGILVPAKTVLYENGKFVQEINLVEIKCRLPNLEEDLFMRY